jgi:predicted ATPase
MIGEQLLHYRILERLGAGGMGTVYRAQDTRLGRVVAVKFLHEAVENADWLRIEARAAARLDHINVGTIYAIEQLDDGRMFLAMAYYGGHSLDELLRERGALLIHEALGYTMQAAKGLGHAHERGVVHRDVKPANLFLCEGQIKVLDFGLARLTDLSLFSQKGSLIGTVEYMAPEQVSGQSATAQSDVWALAVVLYRLIVGVTPFAAANNLAQTVLRIAAEQPDLSLLPSELRPVLERALQKLVAARTPSMAAFLAELEQVAGSLTYSAPSGLATQILAPRSQPSAPSGRAEASASGSRPSQRGSAGSGGAAAPQPPRATSALIGREAEMQLAQHYLTTPECRLLTLFGPGGVGKSRLALAMAEEAVKQQCYDEMYWVSLEGFEEARFIPEAISQAMGLPTAGVALDAVRAALSHSRVLLVLDNIEHLAGNSSAADVLDTLLGDCPELGFLVTSRVRLGLLDEYLLPVAGLAFPDVPEGKSITAQAAREYPAIRLFIQRAKRVTPLFELQNSQVPALLQICQLVSGTPLGLELAATWIRAMALPEIANAITGNLDFLQGRERNRASRHQGLRAVFNSSWNLLRENEQQALLGLAVFRGGFASHAARVVVGASIEVLLSLMDQSLIFSTQVQGGEGQEERFELHPLVMQFALEMLKQRTEQHQRLADKHLQYFLAFTQLESGYLRGSEAAKHQQKLRLERGNVRAALDWAIATHPRSAVALAQALHPYWRMQGDIREGITCMTHVLEHLEVQDRRLLIDAHLLIGRLKMQSGQSSEAQRHFESALVMAGAINDELRLAQALVQCARQAYFLRNYGKMQAWSQEALRLARKNHDVTVIIEVLRWLGRVTMMTMLTEQNLAQALIYTNEALAYTNEALALAVQHDDMDSKMFCLATLAQHALVTGDLTASQQLLNEALTIAHAMGSRHNIAELNMLLSWPLMILGEDSQALLLLEEARDIFEQMQNMALAARCLLNVGILRLKAGNHEAAQVWFAKSDQIISTHKMMVPQGVVYFEILVGLACIELERNPSQAAVLLSCAIHLPHVLAEQLLRARPLHQRLAARLSASDLASATLHGEQQRADDLITAQIGRPVDVLAS